MSTSGTNINGLISILHHWLRIVLAMPAIPEDSTLSIAMALRGRPLVRTTANWDGRWRGDSGPPEALAHRIIVWEAWHHKHGWRVKSPLIPDLQYPTWTEPEKR